VIQLELTGEERQILREVLASSLADLRMEIADTDRLAFRNELKVRKEVIAKALAALDE